MYDMIALMIEAKPGDLVVTKKIIKRTGYIIAQSTPLYFVSIDKDNEDVIVATDVALENTIHISLRCIQSIVNSTQQVIYQANIRDMVYGI
jgi:hypothetical protein